MACANGEVVTPLTLGNSDYGVQHPLPFDGYIYNHNSIKFTMLFTFPIRRVSFDYEIFPNGNCGDPNPNVPNPKGHCSVFPDFTFKAGKSPLGPGHYPSREQPGPFSGGLPWPLYPLPCQQME